MHPHPPWIRQWTTLWLRQFTYTVRRGEKNCGANNCGACMHDAFELMTNGLSDLTYRFHQRFQAEGVVIWMN
jgi:hypothetical protein